MVSERLENREVIFEFRPTGNVMRVSALDVETLTEIVVQCPLKAGEDVFKQLALARLAYRLKKDGVID